MSAMAFQIASVSIDIKLSQIQTHTRRKLGKVAFIILTDFPLISLPWNVFVAICGNFLYILRLHSNGCSHKDQVNLNRVTFYDITNPLSQYYKLHTQRTKVADSHIVYVDCVHCIWRFIYHIHSVLYLTTNSTVISLTSINKIKFPSVMMWS